MLAMEGRELMDSILSTAASMQILADELDRISIHSSCGLHSPSRDSLHSSSKYDSAFDSHYSEDTVSLNSQVVSVSYPIDVETSILPSILTPPMPYRVVATRENMESSGRQPAAPSTDRYRKKGKQTKEPRTQRTPGVSSSPSPSPLVTRQLMCTGEGSSVEHTGEGQGSSASLSPSVMHQLTGEGQKSSPCLSATSTESHSHPHRTVSHLMSNSSLPTIHQPQRIYVQPSPLEEESARDQITCTRTTSDTTPTIPQRYDAEVTPTKFLVVPSEDEVACFPTHQRRLSESSSTDDLISNDSTSTPTVERRQPQSYLTEGDSLGLTPRVTIIYANHASDSEYSDDSPLTSRHNYFPKTGTMFYQERLTPQSSPLHAAQRHSTPHMLPSRYRDTTHNSQPNSRSVKRSGSILQRLKRKKGSFKEDGILKRRLPVKRSLSDRMAYHIKKGWVDYEEDLEFISQPTHLRAVGRMIDKKAGKYHVVQLYKPPSGRYGIYISQQGSKGAVFISRFANNTAEKFYSGLINPGDQIIRIDGKNIGQHSVDDVYNLMTVSNSVIFTVIPVNSRSDW